VPIPAAIALFLQFATPRWPMRPSARQNSDRHETSAGDNPSAARHYGDTVAKNGAGIHYLSTMKASKAA
jgi:hypothetical protein